jgi:hypothetical protein
VSESDIPRINDLIDDQSICVFPLVLVFSLQRNTSPTSGSAFISAALSFAQSRSRFAGLIRASRPHLSLYTTVAVRFLDSIVGQLN